MSNPYQQYNTPQLSQGTDTALKVAWFFVGFLLGIAGILVAYVTTHDKPSITSKDAIMFSAIGFGATFVMGFLSFIFTTIFGLSLFGGALNFINW